MIITPSREFRCYSCGRIDRYDIDAKPVHCGREMKPGATSVPRSGTFRVDLVKLKPGNPKWKENDRWGDQWEVWLLWAGRQGKQGEDDSLFIGTVGQTPLQGWEFEMAAGYTPLGGAGFNRDPVVAEMVMIATQGDV